MGRAVLKSRGRLVAATTAALAAVVTAAAGTLASSGASDAGRGVASSKSQAALPLATAVFDPITFSGPERALGFKHVRQAGAAFVRLDLRWPEVAPEGSTRPTSFSPRNPADRLYSWTAFDEQVRSAVAAGLAPIVDVVGAPVWAYGGKIARAQDGPRLPSPSALADFATATAKRYGGGFRGLPRVRYWQVWNEPNLSVYLTPQFDGTKLVGASWYRKMVNAMSDAVHTVHRDSVVIAGGLSPFAQTQNALEGPGPMRFMRAFLCMSGGAKPRPTCRDRAHFDVWSHHPYSQGGPTWHAQLAENASIGDLGRMRAVLDAAQSAGHIQTSRKLEFWVTEFSWDTDPPDPGTVPIALHTRWVAEALYRMWSDGVSLVTWFMIRDQPRFQSPYQSGLYFRGDGGIETDRPKPSLEAFRFPFVAYPRSGDTIFYWGRTPPGNWREVVVEQASGNDWRRVATIRPDRYGIFSGKISSAAKTGELRARLTQTNETSMSFNLVEPPGWTGNPFG